MYATSLDEHRLVTEDETQGRQILGQVVESAESGDLAYLDYALGSLVIEEPDGAARVERPLSGRYVLAFVGDTVLVVEVAAEGLVLRARDRQGELVRELGVSASTRGPVPVSHDNNRVLVSSEGALVELDVTSGERRELLSEGRLYSAAYAADESVVALETANVGVAGFRSSLALVTSGGTRRDFFEDRDQCNGRVNVSPDGKYVAVRCGDPAVLEFYDLESGSVVATVSDGWVLGYSSAGEVAMVATNASGEAWLLAQPMSSEPPRRVAKIADADNASILPVAYAP